MKPALWGVAAAALLVIAAGGWFILHGASVSLPALSEAGKSDAAAQQLAGPGPAVPSASASSPAEQAPSPNVAAGSSGPAVPSAPASRATEPGVSREQAVPQPAPVVTVPIRASFDCAKASNDAERLICADRELAALDVRMADLYQLGLNSVADSNEFTGEQKVWLSRRDACTDRQCLVVSYDDRIKDLQRWIRR
jgi:uncharacterized protein YecT (DUF1311 family)